MRRRSFRGAVAVLALTTAALIGTAGSALACYSDDTRPNPTPGKPTPCADGKVLDQKDVVFELTKNNTRLNIKSVNEGVTVTRIVVVGGNDGFNDYTPGKKLDKNAPWNDLRAPFNYDRTQPKIDKWFLCGTKKPKPTEPAPTTTTKPSTPATETTKPSTPATSETSVSPTSSTTAPAVVPAGNESGTGGGLANTGFDNSWLIWVGALLLAAGGGLLALLKFRRKASE
ncbi:LPXTG cell wall anchor domain-containing protein [Amycolatopsis tolypomycina]|uniref:LPXTG-motif cell wall anchor domain-containing protein n=1 Tax=Amycolatopsis tolypomycina TaxID=208445 RepID=A0A1H5BSW3_9PSEU|nr:LPXTG cell wall anchor domain-containing protein [Amycolatopsis tolypomycina]SED57683.1 LPXTG-motif cell wall anchor domain-containing protein [Amycolatopsis tolypomycina]